MGTWAMTATAANLVRGGVRTGDTSLAATDGGLTTTAVARNRENGMRCCKKISDGCEMVTRFKARNHPNMHGQKRLRCRVPNRIFFRSRLLHRKGCRHFVVSWRLRLKSGIIPAGWLCGILNI